VREETRLASADSLAKHAACSYYCLDSEFSKRIYQLRPIVLRKVLQTKLHHGKYAGYTTTLVERLSSIEESYHPVSIFISFSPKFRFHEERISFESGLI
jgi:hypothetical protein